MWDEITYPFPNLNSAATEIWECVGYFMPHFSGQVITYPYCVWNSPGIGEFPAQRPVMRSFDIFFDLHLNKRLSKQSWGWWLRHYCIHCDVTVMSHM